MEQDVEVVGGVKVEVSHFVIVQAKGEKTSVRLTHMKSVTNLTVEEGKVLIVPAHNLCYLLADAATVQIVNRQGKQVFP